jgi:hypothetical protein
MAMIELTIYPNHIAEMSVGQLAALPVEQKAEIDKNIDQALAWLKKARAKFDAALDQCYGERAREVLNASGDDFGTAHIHDGPLHIKVEVPKKVQWDQKKLGEIAARYVAAGQSVDHYMDVKLSVPENRFKGWPETLQQDFAVARTVEPGKPSFTLSMDGGAA